MRLAARAACLTTTISRRRLVAAAVWAGRNGNGGAFGTFLERIPGFAIQNIPFQIPYPAVTDRTNGYI